MFLHIRKSKEAGRPFSLIRLGDGEASILGYPEITGIGMEDVANSMSNWFDRPTWKWQMTNLFEAVRDLNRYRLRRAVLDLVYPNRKYKPVIYDPSRIRIGFTPRRTMKPKAIWEEKDVLVLSDALRHSVANADIVGVPNKKSHHPICATIETSLTSLNLLAESSLLTYSGVSRSLNDALLYRPMLEKLDFVGIISGRDMEEKMKRNFGIREVRQYKVRSEPHFPNSVSMRHYPDRFNEIRQTLEVPYPGALFLVGAGIFGKIYCEWIKRRGGIAVDVGALFDSWANFGRVFSRTYRLDAYDMYKRISRLEAIGRHNAILDYQGSGGPKAAPDDDYVHALPDYW